MNDNFDDFTQQARSAVHDAIRVAHSLQLPASEISLLVALLSDPSTTTARCVLKDCGIALTPLLAVATSRTYLYGRRPPANILPPEGAVERIVAEAREIVARNDGLYVGTHHLLAAMLEHPEGVTTRILRSRGVDIGGVRKGLVRRIAEVVDTNEQPYIEGAELRIWGEGGDIQALIRRANGLNRPIDDLIWEAVRRVWLEPQEDAPKLPDIT